MDKLEEALHVASFYVAAEHVSERVRAFTLRALGAALAEADQAAVDAGYALAVDPVALVRDWREEICLLTRSNKDAEALSDRLGCCFQEAAFALTGVHVEINADNMTGGRDYGVPARMVVEARLKKARVLPAWTWPYH